MAATDPSEPRIPADIRAMRNARDFDRLKADGAFEDMNPDAVEAVLDVFARENRKKPKRFWSAMILSSVLFSVMASLIIDLVWKGHGSGFSGAFVGASMGLGAMLASTPLQRRLAVLIAGLDDVRVVGPLADALDRQESSSRTAAVGALTRLLPRLTREEAGLLSAEQRKRLGASLAGDSADLAAAALDALVRVGDTSCYERVERLSEGKGLAKKHADLWQAAKAAMPELAALRENERLAETLLRPADAPADATLLRPADSVPTGDEATLLRPADEPAPEVEAHG